MASDARETMKLKQRIRNEQKAVRSQLQKLGEIYLKQLESEGIEPTEEEQEIMERIDAHKRTIDECHDSLEALSVTKETL
jgi:ubiquinone biosynthesis protein Coq4